MRDERDIVFSFDLFPGWQGRCLHMISVSAPPASSGIAFAALTTLAEDARGHQKYDQRDCCINQFTIFHAHHFSWSVFFSQRFLFEVVVIRGGAEHFPSKVFTLRAVAEAGMGLNPVSLLLWSSHE